MEKDIAFCTLTQTFEVPLIPKPTISNQHSLLHGTAKVLFRWRRLRHPYVHCTEDKIKAQRSHLTDSILPKKCCLHPRFLQPNSPFSLPQYCHGPWLTFDNFSYARISHRTTQYHIMPGSWALNTSTHKTGVPGLHFGHSINNNLISGSFSWSPPRTDRRTRKHQCHTQTRQQTSAIGLALDLLPSCDNWASMLRYQRQALASGPGVAPVLMAGPEPQVLMQKVLPCPFQESYWHIRAETQLKDFTPVTSLQLLTVDFFSPAVRSPGPATTGSRVSKTNSLSVQFTATSSSYCVPLSSWGFFPLFLG